MRMLNPPHPGAFVRTEVIEPLGLTVGAAAAALGVSALGRSVSSGTRRGWTRSSFLSPRAGRRGSSDALSLSDSVKRDGFDGAAGQ